MKLTTEKRQEIRNRVRHQMEAKERDRKRSSFLAYTERMVMSEGDRDNPNPHTQIGLMDSALAACCRYGASLETIERLHQDVRSALSYD